MTSILLSLSENCYCLMCDICFAVIVKTLVVVLCATSVLLSLSDTVVVVVCDVCFTVIVRHSVLLSCV